MKNLKDRQPSHLNLGQYLKRYAPLYLFAFLFMCIRIILDMISPLFVKDLINEVVLGGDTKRTLPLIGGILGISISIAFLNYFKDLLVDTSSINVGRDLRLKVFRHIEGLSLRFFRKSNTGKLMARVKDDVDTVWTGTGFIGFMALESLIHLLAIFGMMLSLSVPLSLSVLFFLPVVGVLAVRLEKKIGVIYGKISDQNARLTTAAQENLAGVRTVKAFAKEKEEYKEFEKLSKEYYSLMMERIRILARFDPLITFLTQCVNTAVVVVGGLLVIHGKANLGILAAFILYANNIVWPMEMVGWLSNELASAFASAKKLNKLLGEESEIKEPSEPVHLPENGERNLMLKDVALSIDGREILKDISFTLPRGKTLGIMGMTGSGKSTLIRLIERFIDPTEGEIRIDGIPLTELPLEELRSVTAVVSQDVFLFSDTIREKITMGLRRSVSEEELREAASLAEASSFIEALPKGYDTIVGERGVGLSGGQKQRISMARAFVRKAPILILDDATSALDPETEALIEQKLKHSEGESRILIAHRISTVRHADEILFLENGRVAERGTHEELMSLKGLYYETHLLQKGGVA